MSVNESNSPTETSPPESAVRSRLLATAAGLAHASSSLPTPTESESQPGVARGARGDREKERDRWLCVPPFAVRVRRSARALLVQLLAGKTLGAEKESKAKATPHGWGVSSAGELVDVVALHGARLAMLSVDLTSGTAGAQLSVIDLRVSSDFFVFV